MEAWRRRALDAFPELRQRLTDPDDDDMDVIRGLTRELGVMLEGAHRDGNEDLLRRIYSYAEWCWNGGDGYDVGVAVTYGFYEHLVDPDPRLWAEVMPRLTDDVIVDMWPLWEYRLSRWQLRRLKRLLKRQGRDIPAILG